MPQAALRVARGGRVRALLVARAERHNHGVTRKLDDVAVERIDEVDDLRKVVVHAVGQQLHARRALLRQHLCQLGEALDVGNHHRNLHLDHLGREGAAGRLDLAHVALVKRGIPRRIQRNVLHKHLGHKREQAAERIGNLQGRAAVVLLRGLLLDGRSGWRGWNRAGGRRPVASVCAAMAGAGWLALVVRHRHQQAVQAGHQRLQLLAQVGFGAGVWALGRASVRIWRASAATEDVEERGASLSTARSHHRVAADARPGLARSQPASRRVGRRNPSSILAAATPWQVH
mmetsp:Transcript_40354/g.120383  ORF Transcript_40354/g.120383 Transcript_40354/m.120383 type:complete len:288 (+) Transcript_40354:657-1520(+)